MTAEKTIELLEAAKQSVKEQMPVLTRINPQILKALEKNALMFIEAYSTAIEALEKQIPKKPVHVHEEYEKHDWKKDDDGNIDEFAWDENFCNGVICERCGDSLCIHCYPDYDEDKCVVDRDICPNCGSKFFRYAAKEPNCPKCGQAIDWSEEE